jgi:cell division protein FtsB
MEIKQSTGQMSLKDFMTSNKAFQQRRNDDALKTELRKLRESIVMLEKQIAQLTKTINK